MQDFISGHHLGTITLFHSCHWHHSNSIVWGKRERERDRETNEHKRLHGHTALLFKSRIAYVQQWGELAEGDFQGGWGQEFTDGCRVAAGRACSESGMTWAERRVDVLLLEGAGSGMLIDHLRQQDSKRRQKLRSCRCYDQTQLMCHFDVQNLAQFSQQRSNALLFCFEQLCTCIKSN